MILAERFKGCIIGGAIGDAFGSGYENIPNERDDIFYPFGKPEKAEPKWQITDDTQLTLATIEAMCKSDFLKPETLAKHFLKKYKEKKLRGLGASTLKALRELYFGGHWSQVGRRGEYAAGNGAAMRIAPLAFNIKISNSQIRDFCSITHNNDEAYIGAMCIIIAIREILFENWKGHSNLIPLIINKIPDTLVRDRLIEIKDIENLKTIGELGNSGYVVDSIPLAIAAANQVKRIGIEKMYLNLIDIGGDTDTNCSMAGQIAGALVKQKGIPTRLIDKLSCLKEYDSIVQTTNNLIEKYKWK
jgi:ADP-ribosylglycohydrolase